MTPQQMTPQQMTPKGKEKEKKKSSAPRFTPPELARGEIDRLVFDDWLKIRKAKRAPVTATAWSAIVREAGKAGISVDDALRLCVEHGWQSLRASWPGVQEEARRLKGLPEPAPMRSAAPRAAGSGWAQPQELVMTDPERNAWDQYVSYCSEGRIRSKEQRERWARWAIEHYPGGALEARARGVLHKAGLA